MRPLLQATVLTFGLAAATEANATYSAPLTEVRIDTDRFLHTPSVVRAGERRTFDNADLELTGWGGQYLGQYESSSGFSLLVGVAAGYGTVDADLSAQVLGQVSADAEGFWLGGQVRGAYMVWQSEAVEGQRPSAITAFVNLRTLYYDMTDDPMVGSRAELRFSTLTGGIGAMAEWSVAEDISICPYAWATPSFFTNLDWSFGGQDFKISEGFTLRNPFLVGIDLWIYPSPDDWSDHFAVSLLGSFVDTSGDDRTLAVVIGYTF